MTYSDYKISLDINDHSSRVSLKAKRGDTGRILYITLKDGGKPYIITSECRAVFTAKKADGNILYNDCSVVGNTIAYAFTPQTTSSVGKADCEIKLYGADDKLLTSARFALVVEDAVYNEGDEVESETEVSALTKLVSEASSLINTVETKLANGDFVGKPGPVGPAGADGTVSFDELTEEQRESLCGPIVSGEGKYSAQGGIGNEVISEAGFTHGKGNFVGLKGYYYSNIDFTTNEITLSKKQLAADGDGIQLEWAIGDVVSIVNDRKYDLCSTITAINGNVITVDSLPFTELGEDQPDWDDYCIFVPDKPEAGVVDLGRYATAIGEGNRATARAATTIGRDNIVQSMYGVCLGRGNTVKAYAGVTTGAFNTIEAEALYGSADGVQNTVTAPIAHAGGSNSKATKDGADAGGYKCEADGEWSLARNYKTKATAPYAVALNEETEAGARGSLTGGKGTKTVEPYQTSLGKYNKPSTNYLFNIGCGTSDANRLNALAVHKDGNLNVFLHRIRNVGDAVDDVDAVNLSQLNAGLAEKAPAGYGLGESGGAYVENINIARNGWYRITPSTIGGIGNYALVRVDAQDERNVHQTAYSGLATSAGFIVMKRTCYDGAWGEWEYENPPMVLGQKYRTTERVNGLPVYAKLVDCGTLPNNDLVSIDIDANIEINVIVNHELYICYLGDTHPYYRKENHSKVSTDIVYDPFTSAEGGILSEFYINIDTTDNMSGWRGVALVKWTEI